MLMRLALVLMIGEAVRLTVTGEAAGLVEEVVEEVREDTKLLVMVSVLKMCNNQPICDDWIGERLN